MRLVCWLTPLVSFCFSYAVQAQAAQTINLAQATAAFAEARQISTQDAGHLWGKPLYGPMIFVDPETRSAVANESAGEQLQRQGELYVGTFPKEMVIANTAVEWAGKRWTMVMWPLPSQRQSRELLLAHELFHRIQPELRIPLASPANPQLDLLEGRIWLQLEWRALTAALIENGVTQREAIRDLLAFRARRHDLFPGSAESERALELNEGLAEYTGSILSLPDANSARWTAVKQLTNPGSKTFVRSFAYTSGPAYGLLLDQLQPGWRTKITTQSDLGLMLGQTLQDGHTVSAEQRAIIYGGVQLRAAETERAAIADAAKVRYRKLLVEGATLTLLNSGKFNYGFNPNELVPLGEIGTVYPTMQASDTWGTLDVTQGALLATDFSSLTVAAPADIAETPLQGAGWKLDLVEGWHLTPAVRSGSYTLVHK